MRIPFMVLGPTEDRPEIEAAIRRVLDRGWFVLGPEVEAFETEFAQASGAAHAVGVNTGTDALMLALRALDIGPVDEVITTALTAAYTALAIRMAGATPVFADIDPIRCTLAPDAVEAAVTSRTRAIMPVHLYGQACDMAALAAIGARHGLAVVEDCAQAHLATSAGRPVGTFGLAGAFSFYPTKNLGALGDGGAIITNDAELAERLRRLRNGGQTDRYRHLEAGVNSRLDELQAAVLRARLPRLQGWTGVRRRLATRYRALPGGGPVALAPEVDSGHVYHLFTVRTPQRAALQAHLNASGIGTLVHYPVTVPRQPAFSDLQETDCPVADLTSAEILSLPLHPGLTDADIDDVAAAVHRFASSTSQVAARR